MEEACKSLKLVRFFIFSPLSFSSRRFFFVGRVCPTDFTDIHRYSSSWFFSSDFTEESEAFLLIGLLTDFRGILAAGQWLAPYICSCFFCHADFADDADFSSWEGFVPQISQIYTDFLWNLWWISLSNLRGYLQRPDRSHLRKSVSNRHSRKSPNKFRIIRWWKKSASSAKSAWQKKRPKKNLCKSVKSVGLFPISGGICNDRTGRICEICVTKKTDLHRWFSPILYFLFGHFII